MRFVAHATKEKQSKSKDGFRRQKFSVGGIPWSSLAAARARNSELGVSLDSDLPVSISSAQI